MNLRVSGALATAAVLAFTNAASAQSAGYFQYIPNGYQQGVIAPAASSTYQATPSAAATNGTSFFMQPQATYTQPAASGYVQQPFAAAPSYTTAPAVQQPTVTGSATTPSYASTTQQGFASPYTPSGQISYTPSVAPTYVAPSYGTANTTYQTLQAPGYQAQQMPLYQQPAFQQPAFGTAIAQQPFQAPAGYTPLVPASATPSNDSGLEDTDAWSFNFARFYPAVQACLRKSAAKNPVIANIQVSDNKTMMLIGEGGSADYSICSTGLNGTTVKANSEIRTMPPAFYAPLGSTFTVSPDRPFQPIVDTDQKIIGWMVRTQPTNAVNQFGQAANFDGQFIPPMMVNTSAGKS